MNDLKLKKIFEAARREAAPAGPDDLDSRVMRQVQREAGSQPQSLSLADQLNALFPRLAFAAAAIILLCVAGDFLLSGTDAPGITEGVTQISNQWLLPENGI